MAARKTVGSTDRMLLAQVILIGLFIVLLFALYLIPVMTEVPYRPGAWRWITLAIPFFGALYLETRRRRANQRKAVREVAEEAYDPATEEEVIDDPLQDDPRVG